MPITISPNQIHIKKQDGSGFLPGNVVAGETTEEMCAAVEATGQDTIDHVNQAVADAQSAVNTLDAQKNSIANTVASMAQLGTDTSLATPGMAADAAKTGEEVGNLKSALSEETRNLIFEKFTGKTVASDGKIGNNASYDVHIAPITSGEKYALSSGERNNESPRQPFACYSVFATIPVPGTTASYDGRHIVTGADRVITAPITGYIALRSETGYQYAQIEHGETFTEFIPHLTATDFSVREEVDGILAHKDAEPFYYSALKFDFADPSEIIFSNVDDLPFRTTDGRYNLSFSNMASQLTSTYATWDSTNKIFTLEMPEVSAMFFDKDTHEVSIKVDEYDVPENSILLLYRHSGFIGGVLFNNLMSRKYYFAQRADIFYPPNLKYDFSDVSSVKLSNASGLYFRKNSGRHDLSFSDMATQLTSTYATWDSTNNVFTLTLPEVGAVYYHKDTHTVSISVSTYEVPDNSILLIYRYYTELGGAIINDLMSIKQVSQKVADLYYPANLDIDFSDIEHIKFSKTTLLYFITSTGRAILNFSAIATKLTSTYATWDSTNNVLTLNLPQIAYLYYIHDENTVELVIPVSAATYKAPKNSTLLLYRYYSDIGGKLYNEYFARQSVKALDEEWFKTSIAKYSEQITNVYCAADYYRGGGTEVCHPLFTMMLATDTHGDTEAISNSIKMAEYLLPVHGYIHLGDMIQADYQTHDGTNVVKNIVELIKPTKPVLVAMGNHDEQTRKMSETVATVEESVAKVCPYLNTASAYSSRGYGYYDFTDQKVRVIVLNSFDYPDTTTDGDYQFYGDSLLFQQAQVTAFVNALKSVPEGYTVILAMHWPEHGVINDTYRKQHASAETISPTNNTDVGTLTYMSDLVISDIINAYKNRTTIQKNYTYSNGTNTGSVSVNEDFSEADGEFAICIAGHRHKECVAKSEVGDYWIYIHDTSGCGYISGSWQSMYSNQPRSLTTNARDLMTCMSIDTANKLIKFTRIGAHINRFLEDTNFLVLEYGSN